MRRAQSQSVRHNARPSLATFGVDDLGVLNEESGESLEDVLRRQLLEKDREIDKVILRPTSSMSLIQWKSSS